MLSQLALIAAAFAAVSSAAPIVPVEVSLVAAAINPPNTTQTNEVVYYYQHGRPGACGEYSEDSDLVVGLPLEFFSDLGRVSPYCGDFVKITNPSNNATVLAKIADASALNQTLSLSIATYNALKDDGEGPETVNWRFATDEEEESAVAASPVASSNSDDDDDSEDEPSFTSARPTTTSSTARSAPTAESNNDDDDEPTSTWTPTSTSRSTTRTTTRTTTRSTTRTSTWTPASTPRTTTTPRPTTTWQAPAPATTQQQQQQQQQSSSSGGQFQGRGTYYLQNGNPGACGQYNSDSAMIVAVNPAQYGGSCGRGVRINANGRSIYATAVDLCPSCGYGSLDLSVSAFSALSGLGAGVISISWSWA